MQRFTAFTVISFAALGVFAMGGGFSSEELDAREKLTGSWQLQEKVCLRKGHPPKILDYQDERTKLISVLHFKRPDRGVIEEIHLSKRTSCSGRAAFSLAFQNDFRVKLTRAPMIWEGGSRSVAQLGCHGDEQEAVSYFSYAYDSARDQLKLTHQEHSRSCDELISVYRRDGQ
jgi:hypothetical protein